MHMISSTYTTRYSQYASPDGLEARLRYTSESPLVLVNPRLSISLERCCLQLAPEVLSLYKARIITAFLPVCSCPNNSGPHLTCTLSLHFTLRYALPMSADRRTRLFNAAIRNINRMLSLDATEEKVVNGETDLFLCPPATSRAFLVRSNLTSKII